MAIYVSPGAYVREIDLSLYVPAISTTIFGVIGTASKGPLNQAVFVSSQADFVRKFGNPHPDHLMSFSAMQYLRRGTKLWVVRVGTADAQASEADLIGGPTEAEIQSDPNLWTFTAPASGEVITRHNGPYLFTGARNLVFKLLDAAGNDTVDSEGNKFSASGSFTAAVSTGAGNVNADVVAGKIIKAANFAYVVGDSVGTYLIDATHKTIKIEVGGTGGGSPVELDLILGAARTATEIVGEINASGFATYVLADVTADNRIRVRTKTGGTGVTLKFTAPSGNDATDTLFGVNVTLETEVSFSTRVKTEIVNNNINPTAVLTGVAAQTGWIRMINDDYTGALSGVRITRSAGDAAPNSSDEALTLLGLGLNGDGSQTAADEPVDPYTPAGTPNQGDDGTDTLTIEVNAPGATSGVFTISEGAGVSASTVRNNLRTGVNATVLEDLGLDVYLTSDNRIVFRRIYIPGTTDPLVPTGAQWIKALSVGSTVNDTTNGPNDKKVWTDYDAEHYGSAGGLATGTVSARSEGTWGNNLKVVATAGSQSGTFKLTVWEKHPVTGIYVTAETWDNLDANPVADNYYVDIINNEIGGSQYINVADSGEQERPAGTFTLVLGHDGAGKCDDRGTPYLGGLVDGDPDAVVCDGSSPGDPAPVAVKDSIYIGTNPAPTGMMIFRSAELIDVNLMAVPGVSSPNVILAMITVCEDRGDCMALVDPPIGLSVQQVVDWHNGAGPYTDHQAFNTSYAALYWPWLVVFDAYNGVNVLTPPSGHVAGVIAYTDYIRQLWFAPAGLQRGLLPSAINLETTSPSQGDRDLMYGYPNNVNPIAKFTGIGIAVWGQKTLWRQPTAVDRVNVRRLLLYARKIVASTVRYLVFEPNDPPTWRAFVRLVQPWLENIRQKRGLIDFRVICDETTNPPDQIDQNVMNGRIFLKPTKAAEIIQVDFVLTNTGAKFEEIIY